MRWVVALAAFVFPPLLAVVFVKLTSSPSDANVGGALYLILGLTLGVVAAIAVLKRQV